jgi:MoaA/NifB/PqqE/SkfB family radical SAM enzyme
LNRHYYPSLGKPCLAGHSTFTVDGSGDVRRCHFIDKCIGNIYQPGFGRRLKLQMCTNQTCGCHIGYVHRPEMKLYELYGEDFLARIPATWPTRDTTFLTLSDPSAMSE